MFNDEHVSELLPAFALGCLDDSENEIVRRHLDGCAVCRMELDSYQNVTGQLGLAVEIKDPPQDLKKRIFAALPPAQSKTETGFKLLGRTISLPSFSFAWGMAGLFLLIILGLSNLLLWQQLNGLKSSTQYKTFQSVALSGTSFSPNASGLMVISFNGEYGSLIVQGLQPLDASRQYQLWLMKDGQRTNGGVFSVNKEGYTSILVYSSLPLATYSSFGITIEPAGGSPAPTGEKVLGGSF